MCGAIFPADKVNQAMVAAVDSAAFEMHTAIFAQRLASMVLVPVSMSLTGSAYVDLPVKERVSGLKLLQLMTGLSSERYWLATFATDLLTHVVSSLFCTLPLLFLDRDIWFCRDHYKLGARLTLECRLAHRCLRAVLACKNNFGAFLCDMISES